MKFLLHFIINTRVDIFISFLIFFNNNNQRYLKLLILKLKKFYFKNLENFKDLKIILIISLNKKKLES